MWRTSTIFHHIFLGKTKGLHLPVFSCQNLISCKIPPCYKEKAVRSRKYEGKAVTNFPTGQIYCKPTQRSSRQQKCQQKGFLRRAALEPPLLPNLPRTGKPTPQWRWHREPDSSLYQNAPDSCVTHEIGFRDPRRAPPGKVVQPSS